MSKRILIVDDSTSVRQMVEATLKTANYTVTAAKDGLEALNFCKSNRYNFVLTDQNMPNMDGLTLIKSLRSIPSYTTTPIVVLTTEAGGRFTKVGKSKCSTRAN